ncbi:MAG: hypothetical protein C0482_03725 [Gordonia sp.]|uniref:DUF6474 family protein n=1 Tax=Gordonia rubripertincta TaxID=36822 RepID=A0ABT4MR16_GORRU|nr:MULTISPECIES: DUF6474 family protein [Mycobacteriales]MBA4021447.1 hypothetical protein [Gordonia sp. (in: high G+C Gram-positive bacteria)]MCZ4549449.1 DUF6474 family protein [Gordonia rubripertincta]OZG30638.1 hypothetical protein BH683_003100 [Williamsia sp. 1138]
MGLFSSGRTSRAQRKAQAKALKAKAKLEARLEDKSGRKDAKAERKQQRKLAKKSFKAQAQLDKNAAKVLSKTNETNLKIAQANAKAVADGKVLSTARVKRYLQVAKVLSPVLVPIAYRASTAAREQISRVQADRAGVPIAELNRYSGHGAALSARISGASESLHTLTAKHSDAETKTFTTIMEQRLSDLSTAVAAAEHMPAARRRSAHAAISRELAAIDADLLARLGVRP